MPFREKAKSLFKTKNRGNSQTSSNDSNHDVYKPGEPMPAPKYRRPPAQAHKEKLDSFSFGDAWRKRSFQSSHSPMGTCAPSRRTSRISMGGRKSKASVSEATPGRNGSVISAVSDGEGRQRDTVAGAPLIRLPTEVENEEGDDDVGNVGLSRVQSKDQRGATSRPKTSDGKQANGIPNGLHKSLTAQDHQPFSEQDLQNAMSRSRTQVEAY